VRRQGTLNVASCGWGKTELRALATESAASREETALDPSTGTEGAAASHPPDFGNGHYSASSSASATASSSESAWPTA
jgi:hypothetical protein